MWWGESLWVADVVGVMGSRLCIVVDLVQWLCLFACVGVLVGAFWVAAYVARWVAGGWFWWVLGATWVCLEWF